MSLWRNIRKPAKAVTLETFAADLETEAGSSAAFENCPQGLNKFGFNFFDMRGASERSFRLVINVTEEDDTQADHVLVKSMALTADADAYEYDTGTSMAAPAVAGEAAILSAAFPEEGADQIAAGTGSADRKICMNGCRCPAGILQGIRGLIP